MNVCIKNNKINITEKNAINRRGRSRDSNPLSEDSNLI